MGLKLFHCHYRGMGDGLRVVGQLDGRFLKLLANILGQVFLPSLMDCLIRFLVCSLNGNTPSCRKLETSCRNNASAIPRFLILVRGIGSHFTSGADHGGTLICADRLK